MRKFLIRFCKSCLSLISYCIPKNKSRIYLKSKPDYSGNCKAISDYVNRNNLPYQIVWSVNRIDKKISGISVKNGTLKSLYYYLTSKFIMTTHNEMIGIVARNQLYISLWHGMPLKKICYLGEFDYLGMEDYSAKRIATSEVMRSIISACFREKANNVYITGQPRNDYLFLPVTLSTLGINIQPDQKTLLYIPTFRKNNENNIYSDGDDISNDNFLRVSDFDIVKLNEYLQGNNIHLLLKLHPYEEMIFEGKRSLASNITIIDSAILNKSYIDLNQLLPSVDCLITDYSSVYFDFLILNRPVIFLVPDLVDYGKSRGGFTLEPFEFWTSGDKVKSQGELIESINNALFVSDSYQEQRRNINSVINAFQDDGNSKRVIELFIEGKK